MSFTVDLEEEEAEEEVLPSKPATGKKLSNFLPENLRKSFRERQERIQLSAEKNNQSQVLHPHVMSSQRADCRRTDYRCTDCRRTDYRRTDCRRTDYRRTGFDSDSLTAAKIATKNHCCH